LNADILHISCHARWGESSAEESCLFLAEPLDGRDSGILTAYRIRNELALRPGAVVVLAACSTGLAEYSHHYDMFALPPAFLAAGAGAVLATLWRVRD